MYLLESKNMIKVMDNYWGGKYVLQFGGTSALHTVHQTITPYLFQQYGIVEMLYHA